MTVVDGLLKPRVEERFTIANVKASTFLAGMADEAMIMAMTPPVVPGWNRAVTEDKLMEYGTSPPCPPMPPPCLVHRDYCSAFGAYLLVNDVSKTQIQSGVAARRLRSNHA